MQHNTGVRIHYLLLTASLAAAIGCGGGSQPVSPSALGGAVAPRASVTIGPYEDPPAPAPTPDPTMPTPTPTIPAPAPAPVPITIVGSVGSGAFLPNPTSAVVGNTIVFTNSDLVMHRIVLDDGSGIVMANLLPGQTKIGRAHV